MVLEADSMLRACRGDKREEGATAVEFALIFLLVLAPTLLGLIGFGLALYQQIGVGQLAREAARTAAICAGQPDADAGACAAEGESAVYDSLSDVVGNDVTASMTHYGCGDGGDGSLTMTVTVSPILPIPDVLGVEIVNDIRGRATTPCGG